MLLLKFCMFSKCSRHLYVYVVLVKMLTIAAIITTIVGNWKMYYEAVPVSRFFVCHDKTLHLLFISCLKPVFSAFCRRNQYVVVDRRCQISNILFCADDHLPAWSLKKKSKKKKNSRTLSLKCLLINFHLGIKPFNRAEKKPSSPAIPPAAAVCQLWMWGLWRNA